MKKIKLSAFIIFLLLFGCMTRPTINDTAQYLQDVSVTIQSKSNIKSGGSGIIFNRGGYTYVITCSHVIENFRQTKLIIPKEETKKQKAKVEITFDDVLYFYQRVTTPDMDVHEFYEDLEVVKYSPHDKHDLSLLRTKRKVSPNQSTEFYLENDISNPLTPIYHVGSYKGKFGANSLSQGFISRINVGIKNNVYDQSSCIVHPGSSGGGVFLQDDLKCIGIMIMSAGDSFNFFIPIRNIKLWAQEENIEWIVDHSIPYVHIESKPIIKELSLGILQQEIKKELENQ